MPKYNQIQPHTKYKVYNFMGKVWAAWRADGEGDKPLQEDTILKLKDYKGNMEEALAGELNLINPHYPYQN